MKTLILLLLTLNSFAGAISKGDNPRPILKSYTSNFDLLPLKGEIANKTLGWPGSHWPSYLGSISHRWSATDPEAFKYKLRSKAELLQTKQSLIDEMSPAEKFDILRGKYSYPTVKYLRKRHRPGESTWHGICHGVAVAQMIHSEPKAKTFINKDGIELNFYSSDLKAVISHYYAKYAKLKRTQVGTRCFRRHLGTKQCNGINPASLHLVLTNRMGIDKLPYVTDIDNNNEVWNHVAVAYESYIVDEHEPSATSARGCVKRVRVQTEVKYEGAIQPKFNAVIGTSEAVYLHENYDYYLELDANGKIIGGEWISTGRRPDYLFMKNRAKFSGKWKTLLKFLNDTDS